MNLPIVDAIMDESRPKTHEKGREMASARGPMSATCYKRVIKIANDKIKKKQYDLKVV